ncbi:MAG: glycoside hydrolase family 15 protein [Armatimonadetes bacterium]|nr:glycoside hydrolase family 15 protein [Armatimonadota bacterium]
MPRSLVFGNGSLFVALDSRHRIRELTYPYVGLYNHLAGRAVRMGIWVDGAFTWCDEGGWEVHQSPQFADGSSQTTLRNPHQGIELLVRERIHADEPAFFRDIVVTSHRADECKTRVFFHHPLQLNESDIAETAVLDPVLGGMVHYKGPTFIGFCVDSGPSEVAVGITGYGEQPGTAPDAEDGELSNRTIEQGSIDSCMSVELRLAPGEGRTICCSILCASTITGLHELKERLDREAGALASVETDVAQASRLGSLGSEIGNAEPQHGNKCQSLPGAPEPRSLLTPSRVVIESHLSSNGALMAALDSDIMSENRAHYANFWPRDGALTLEAFLRFKEAGFGRRMLQFCRGLINSRVWPHPFFFQKYRPDGTLGASWHPWVRNGSPELPLQEDESALILHAMGAQVAAFGWEGLEGLWQELAVPLADFLVAYRDPQSGLPLPSHDLWEERRGVHAFTVASAVAGLRAASELAASLGDSRSEHYGAIAEEVRSACLSRFVHAGEGFVVRNLSQDRDGAWHEDLTPDSSMLHVVLLGLLSPDDPLAGSLVDRLEAGLWVDGPIGGMARYRDDYYCRVSHGVPGNPWIICTLWLAQALWKLNRTPQDRTRAVEVFEWALARRGQTGYLPEQVHPFTGEHLSVSPLVWSHGEFIVTASELGLGGE